MRNIYTKLMVFLGFLVCGLLPASLAHAAGDFATAFNNIKSLSDIAGPALKAMFLVCGVFMLGMGLFKWVQASKREEPKGPALTMILVGVALLGIWTFANTMAETIGISVDANF